MGATGMVSATRKRAQQQTQRRQRPPQRAPKDPQQIEAERARKRRIREIQQELLAEMRRNNPRRWGRPGGSSISSAPLPAEVKLELTGVPTLAWRPVSAREVRPVQRPDGLACATQIHGTTQRGDRALTIGLDFGTSSTKVVVGDEAMRSAYAVPLTDGIGPAAYLLPSCLIERGGVYSLDGEGKRHADLKLAMLSNPSDGVACSRVCAYLALVLRSVRAWFFETKQAAYQPYSLLWTLVVGQPSDQASSAQGAALFNSIGLVGWHLAGHEGPITSASAREAWVGRKALPVSDEFEVRVMPELSAQIHGFVSSSHFDARQPNIYLMVDVGAGTVDASLFHVKRTSGAKVSFGLFTHSVEALGAASMHRHRVAWWMHHLSAGGHEGPLITELESLRLPTEFSGGYPASYADYVGGVVAQFSGGAPTPDHTFRQKVRNQVVGGVLYGAWNQNLLTQAAIKDMPYFMCGGGSRHPLFEGLNRDLVYTPGATWLSGKRRQLTVPPNLVAPGLSRSDYDRLSVAYGLSQLNPGDFETVQALVPKVQTPQSTNWGTSYIDKDSC
jgi:hypothetical protein